MATANTVPIEGATDGSTSASTDKDMQSILGALEDTDCRRILEVIGADVLTTSEIADRCDLPLSTAYRKISMLTDAGLLAERTRLCLSGKHTHEYANLVGDVTVSFDTAGRVELELRERE